MKINKKAGIIISIIVVVVIAVIAMTMNSKKPVKITTEYQAKTGTIKVTVSTTGMVQPQNRLEIKPQLAGRMESILVKEGQYVKKGQILAYMSSSDRAALLDAARALGEKNMKEWEDTYKPIPLMAPINGQVIVQSIEPGQTVSTADAIVVLSDRLIIQAQVDETDIGKVKLGQETAITLDAYPGTIIKGSVDHVYYESKTVNNVTIYDVDILPAKVPEFFRSGMSANIDIIQQQKENVVILPIDAVKKFGDKSFVFMKSEKGVKPEKREIVTGITDGDNIEIVSGLNENDVVVVTKQNYVAQSNSQTVNPFMPSRPKMSNGGRNR
jgi:macrolide-specific efflux system membrane fusion protein